MPDLLCDYSKAQSRALPVLADAGLACQAALVLVIVLVILILIEYDHEYDNDHEYK